MSVKKFGISQKIFLICGLLLFFVIFFLPETKTLSIEAKRLASVACLMACWWIGEVIPISITALIPLALFPLLGIMNYSKVAAPYANHNIFLFMGGLFIAMSMQKWNLHRRIALYIIRFIGFSPKKLILGFMVATAFLSMWISNTATTVMMLPIAMAVISYILKENKQNSSDVHDSNFAIALLLSVAYSASIGGIGTLVGTPPNLVFAGVAKELIHDMGEVTFIQWMVIGFPIVILLIPLCWLFLTRVLYPPEKDLKVGSREIILKEIREMGRMSKGERYTLVVFIITGLLWIFRKDIPIGVFTIPGWSRILPDPQLVQDSTVAMIMALTLFILPVNIRKGEFVLDWEWARKIPWGVLLLLGGGFALAEGFKVTSLDQWIGERLEILSGFPPVVMVILVCTLMTFLTEITSNTATASVMMPIMAATASAIGVQPLLLMIPATISASCAFMMPVATPPNAIIFSSGYLTIPKMAKAGLVMNFIGILIITALVFLVAIPVFGL